MRTVVTTAETAEPDLGSLAAASPAEAITGQGTTEDRGGGDWQVAPGWVAELERRWPGSVRLFAPSETQAARTQLGSRRFKTDDRDCAAQVWLARQGTGRPASHGTLEPLTGAVRHRRGLVRDRRVLQQRLHDQLQALCPGLSAPAGHGLALAVESPTGQAAVLACAAAFAGRPPTVRSLLVVRR